MTLIELARSGRAPLKFQGAQLAQARGQDLWKGSEKLRPNRFHTITLYRSESGKYVVQIQFRCNIKYDEPYDEVEVFEKPQDVVEYLSDFDPTEGIRGWTLERHQEQDRRLRTALTNNFETLVSQVLAGQDEFAEKV